MVKCKTKSISNLGTFSNFFKTVRLIYNFLKIPAWNWSGSFCYGAWAQKESAKVRNMRACTDKTGLSSIKLVWLIQKAGWSAQLKAQFTQFLNWWYCYTGQCRLFLLLLPSSDRFMIWSVMVDVNQRTENLLTILLYQFLLVRVMIAKPRIEQ